MLRTLLTKRRDTGIRFPLLKLSFLLRIVRRHLLRIHDMGLMTTEINVHLLFLSPLMLHKINDTI